MQVKWQTEIWDQEKYVVKQNFCPIPFPPTKFVTMPTFPTMFEHFCIRRKQAGSPTVMYFYI